MVLSMTGFGKSTHFFKHKTIVVEIKSLNGKNLEIRMKLSPAYKELELSIRKALSMKLKRGKVDVNITVASEEGEELYNINKAQFKRYYHEIYDLQEELQFGNADYLQSILRLPNAISTVEGEIDEEEHKILNKCIDEAITEFLNFRKNEGKSIDDDLRKRVNEIRQLLESLAEYEESRINHVKDRIWKNLNEQVDSGIIDRNRFEQEVIYYLEKLDINEEKVRLDHHCTHFIEKLDDERDVKGKMLNFISQEMGREINTLGAKAYSSDIQKKVVNMKDELEKIKEQLANVV